jgi:hypothetical protein
LARYSEGGVIRALSVFSVIAAALLAYVAPPAAANHSLVELVSTGPAWETCNSSFCPSDMRDVSDDGHVALFQTREKLTADDTNPYEDLYRREAGVTTHIAPVAYFGSARLSADSETVVFETSSSLVPEDADGGLLDVASRTPKRGLWA